MTLFDPRFLSSWWLRLLSCKCPATTILVSLGRFLVNSVYCFRRIYQKLGFLICCTIMYSVPPPSSVAWPAPQRFTVSTSNKSANASKSLASFSRTCLNLSSSSSLRFPQYLRSRSSLVTSWAATECPKLSMTFRASPWRQLCYQPRNKSSFPWFI